MLLSLLLLTSCSLGLNNRGLNLSTPALSFVETHIANIATEDGQVRYMMRYQLADDAPNNLYAQIYYQDLSNAKLFHTTSIGSIGEVKIINFNSSLSDKIINKQQFEITLILYKDAEYTQSVGIHQDLLLFDMPATVADILHIQLL